MRRRNHTLMGRGNQYVDGWGNRLSMENQNEKWVGWEKHRWMGKGRKGRDVVWSENKTTCSDAMIEGFGNTGRLFEKQRHKYQCHIYGKSKMLLQTHYFH